MRDPRHVVRAAVTGIGASMRLLPSLFRDSLRGADYTHVATVSATENAQLARCARLMEKRAGVDRISFSEYIALSAHLVEVYTGRGMAPLSKSDLNRVLFARRRHRGEIK